MTVVPVYEPDTETHRIVSWRLKTLIDAGYPVLIAERLACSNLVDLHQAVELVHPPANSGRRPCPPELAADILL